MRILHFALSNFYIEGYNYQENVLPRIHSEMGHEVLMLASCESFDDRGCLSSVEPVQYRSVDGFNVIRIPYRKLFRKEPLRRIKTYPKVYQVISEFKPDIMYFHGCGSWEMKTVAKYRKEHPNTKLFIDNHADYHNSARTKLSLIGLHKLIYKNLIHQALPYTEKILCASIECMEFCRGVYNIPKEQLEFFPLGGEIISKDKMEVLRKSVRRKEKITEEDIVFTHSGKFDSRKRTYEIIEAFKTVQNPKFHLWIIGVLMDDVKDKVLDAIEGDKRIHFLGWKPREELIEYLYATDFYVQPGGQSVTMQNAMCCGCAVMLYPHKSHKPYVQGNGYYISDVPDMIRVFRDISENPQRVSLMKEKSYKIAKEILDYQKLAERVCIESTKG